MYGTMRPPLAPVSYPRRRPVGDAVLVAAIVVAAVVVVTASQNGVSRLVPLLVASRRQRVESPPVMTDSPLYHPAIAFRVASNALWLVCPAIAPFLVLEAKLVAKTVHAPY